MKGRLILGATGVGAIVYAIVGALRDTSVRPFGQGLSIIGVVLIHDGIFLPGLLAVGAVLARYCPVTLRAPIQGALIATAAVTVVASPLLLGPGTPADNQSALPRDYPRGWLVLLGVIWATAAAVAAWRNWHVRTRLPDGQQKMVDR
jgi:hypothetical protein